MAASFRMLDDVAVADVAFDAEGDSPAEVIRAAGLAVIETMADPRTVGRTWRQEIRRRDADIAAVLFDVLSEIVFVKDAAGVVFSDLEVAVSEREGAYEVAVTLVGEPIAPDRQDLRADVKAVTKHLYSVGRCDGRWAARVVLDV